MPPKIRLLEKRLIKAGFLYSAGKCSHRKYIHPLGEIVVNRAYSGKFNLRTGEDLHERLALESMKVNESLNTYVVKTLKKELGML